MDTLYETSNITIPSTITLSSSYDWVATIVYGSRQYSHDEYIKLGSYTIRMGVYKLASTEKLSAELLYVLAYYISRPEEQPKSFDEVYQVMQELDFESLYDIDPYDGQRMRPNLYEIISQKNPKCVIVGSPLLHDSMECNSLIFPIFHDGVWCIMHPYDTDRMRDAIYQAGYLIFYTKHNEND